MKLEFNCPKCGKEVLKNEKIGYIKNKKVCRYCYDLIVHPKNFEKRPLYGFGKW